VTYDRAFFAADPVTVARALVGALLEVAAAGSPPAAVRIVEVEAYGGPDDPASHAAPGPTPRSAIMFGPPGLAYVYFIYGMHHCLNFVTCPDGRAGAVLVRAVEPVRGRAAMAARRGLEPGAPDRLLGGGPGRLCRSLGIDLAWNGLPVAARLRRPPGAPGRLRVVAAGGPPPRIVASPRIGVRRGADVLWRFCAADSPCLSAPASAPAHAQPAGPRRVLRPV
jgi:DNA-3-methyladenine glycosylase